VESTYATHYDWGQDYRTFQDGKDTSRCSVPREHIYMQRMRLVGGSGRSTFERIHRTISINYHDKNLDTMCKEMRSCAHQFPQKILDQACGYVRKIFAKDGEGCTTRSNNRRGLLAACLVYSLNYHKAPFKCNEIGEIMNVNGEHVLRGMRLFAELMPEAKSVTGFHTPRPQDFVHRWMANLVKLCPKMSCRRDIFHEKFAQEIADIAIRVLDAIDGAIVDHKPDTLAAGVLWWILLKKGIDQQTVPPLLPSDLTVFSRVSKNAITMVVKKLNTRIQISN
jgi:hypothetical protein